MRYSNIITKALFAGLLLLDAQVFANDQTLNNSDLMLLDTSHANERRMLSGHRRRLKACPTPATANAAT